MFAKYEITFNDLSNDTPLSELQERIRLAMEGEFDVPKSAIQIELVTSAKGQA